MSAPKLIEHLDSPENPLSGEDLLMASVRQNGGYVSKKITLDTLAEFVNSGEKQVSEDGGLLFFDSQESDTYVWDPVHEANSTEFTKIATCDCVAIPFMIDSNFTTTNNIDGADHSIPGWRIYEEVRIDDLLINPVALALANNNAGDSGFYLKKGQKLNVKLTQFAIDKLGVAGTNLSRLRYQFLPITNGGTFVDTDKMKALMAEYPEQYVDSAGNWKYNNATYQDGVPFSFPFPAHVAYYNQYNTIYIDSTQVGETREQYKYAPKIDGKYAHDIWWTRGDTQRIDINLKANQTLEIYSNSPNASSYFDIRSFACVPIMDSPSTNDGSGSVENKSCGYEIYDLSASEGNGSFSSLEVYSNSSKNYAWYLNIPKPTSSFQKTVTKDCVVFIDGVGGQDDYNTAYQWSVYVDDNKIWTYGLRNNVGERKFYIKKGQTLKIDTELYPIKLSVIPLLSGGKFFFDTTKPELFQTGTIGQLSNYQFQASCQTLFTHTYPPNIEEQISSKINGKRIVPIDNVEGGASAAAEYILNTNDVLTVSVYGDNYNAYANAAKWASYPLLVDGSGSISGGSVVPDDGTALNYCILDGNLGILGPEIRNYENVSKWEIKIQQQELTDAQQRKGGSTGNGFDNTYVYEYNSPETSNSELWYNWGQYDSSAQRKTKFIGLMEHYTNPDANNFILMYSSDLYTNGANSYYIAGKYYSASAIRQFVNPFIVQYNKISNDVSIFDGNLNAFTPTNYGYAGAVKSVRNVTTPGYVDHLLSTSDWKWGLWGRVYYIKGYNANNELVANLTPRNKNGHIYMYDSIGGTNVEFHGQGTATAGVAIETLTISELVNRGYDYTWNGNAGSSNMAIKFTTGYSESNHNLPRFDTIEIVDPENDGHGSGTFTVNGLSVITPSRSGYRSGSTWYTTTVNNIAVYNAYGTYEEAQNALLARTVTVYYP